MSVRVFDVQKLSNNILINYESTIVKIHSYRFSFAFVRLDRRNHDCWLFFFFSMKFNSLFFRLSNFGCFHSIKFGWWIDLTCKLATTWIPHLIFIFWSRVKKNLHWKFILYFTFIKIGGPKKCWCQLVPFEIFNKLKKTLLFSVW